MWKTVIHESSEVLELEAVDCLYTRTQSETRDSEPSCCYSSRVVHNPSVNLNWAEQCRGLKHPCNGFLAEFMFVGTPFTKLAKCTVWKVAQFTQNALNAFLKFVSQERVRSACCSASYAQEVSKNKCWCLIILKTQDPRCLDWNIVNADWMGRQWVEFTTAKCFSGFLSARNVSAVLVLV